ncbi:MULTISPECIES: VOC family protein [unclassified Moritella]|uniref:bleomycin resistance protein n=1 Tax=unclassified Moritella TaxID=2637987 RepID=UPI001BAB7EEC|nr:MULTISPECIES: VOC family protein [unclassified Moritella]QUM85839.1 VOC family protein [Moritella sp. 28]QUM90067.1 VOC family protein [Moritella sp. 36]
MNLRVVPELYCVDIDVSKHFYVDILGFSIKYQRPEEQFLFLTLGGVDLMLEGLNSEGRKWLTGDMNVPFGRGVNFQWDTNDIDNIYVRIQSLSPSSIYMELETKTYGCNDQLVTQKQFIVQDPNGYLFRFCEDS